MSGALGEVAGVLGIPSSGATNAYVQGGNAFGALGVLGTTDAFGLQFISGIQAFGFSAPGTEPVISISSSDAATSWWLATGHRIDFGTTDDVLYIGYNVGPGGAPVNPLKPRLWDAWESSFNNGASIVMERHVGEYVSVGGVSRRALSFAFDLGTNDVSFTLTATGNSGTGSVVADQAISVETVGAASSIGVGASAHSRTCLFGTGAAAQTCAVGSTFAGSTTTINGSTSISIAGGAVGIAASSTFAASGAPTADLTGNGMRLRLSFGTATLSNGGGGPGIAFADAGGNQYNLVGAGGVTKLSSSLAYIGTTVELAQFLWLRPTAAPAAPADGWVVYSDIAGGALKAINAAGTVRTLASP